MWRGIRRPVSETNVRDGFATRIPLESHFRDRSLSVARQFFRASASGTEIAIFEEALKLYLQVDRHFHPETVLHNILLAFWTVALMQFGSAKN
jgi:hypothetical protein